MAGRLHGMPQASRRANADVRSRSARGRKLVVAHQGADVQRCHANSSGQGAVVDASPIGEHVVGLHSLGERGSGRQTSRDSMMQEHLLEAREGLNS